MGLPIVICWALDLNLVTNPLSLASGNQGWHCFGPPNLLFIGLCASDSNVGPCLYLLNFLRTHFSKLVFVFFNYFLVSALYFFYYPMWDWDSFPFSIKVTSCVVIWGGQSCFRFVVLSLWRIYLIMGGLSWIPQLQYKIMEAAICYLYAVLYDPLFLMLSLTVL